MTAKEARRQNMSEERKRELEEEEEIKRQTRRKAQAKKRKEQAYKKWLESNEDLFAFCRYKRTLEKDAKKLAKQRRWRKDYYKRTGK